MTSSLKYFGGKGLLAKKIVALFPKKYLHYVEPYFGGGSVLFTKNPDNCSEVVNDINKGLTNFWRCLQDDVAFDRIKHRIQNTPFSENEWVRANKPREDLPSGRLDVGAATAFFVQCRQSRAGMMKDFAPITRNRLRRRMNEQASAWMSAIDGLPEVHARLRRVVVLNRDAIKVIKQEDTKKTLFYLDPPYLHETRTCKEDYEHEMTEDQHRELLETLCGVSGKFLLSGYDSKLYREYEKWAGWDRVEIKIANSAAGGKKKRVMTEVVWKNF